MSAASKYYENKTVFSKRSNLVYVHLHVTNIGKAEDSEINNIGDIQEIINKKKHDAFEASKNQFKTLFLKSLQANEANLLDQIFDIYNNDTLMTQVQSELKGILQTSLDTGRIQGLLNQMQSQDKKNTVSNFIKIIEKGGSDVLNENEIKSINDLFSIFEKCAKIINSKAGQDFLPLAFKVGENWTREQVGMALKVALNTFNRKLDKILLTPNQIEQYNNVIKLLQPLANSFITGKKSSNPKERQTTEGIRRILVNIFSSGFGESLAGSIKHSATNVLNDSILKMTGSNRTHIAYWNESGTQITRTSLDPPQQGKADIILGGTKLSLKSIEDMENIHIDLGISIKTYQNLSFKNNSFISSDSKIPTISSGAGDTLLESIRSTFGNEIRFRYYIYNIMAHEGKKSVEKAQLAFQDVVLTRNIVRLFASRGGNEDFASYILVNGKLISIWDIILGTEGFVGASSSQIEKGQYDEQIVSLHIKDRTKIPNYMKKTKNPKDRVANINNFLSKLRLQAQLNLNKIQF